MGSFCTSRTILSVTIHTKMKYLAVFVLGAIIATTIATPLSKEEKNETTCTICKGFIAQINDLIVDPSNEQAVSDTLKQLCEALFADNIPALELCQNTIDASLPAIIEVILSNSDPETVCTTFG